MNLVSQFFTDISNIAKTRKFWVGVLGFVITFVIQEYATAQWVQYLTAIATMLGVYQVPNKYE